MTAIWQNVTVGVPTTGNTHALLISLTAILQGFAVLPRKILIRSEGHFPGFAHFYLEQLADAFRQRGTEFWFVVTPPGGLRRSVDWLMANCGTPYLWIVADDVLPSSTALSNLQAACDTLNSRNERWGYICGLKQDVNNRRGWPDYSQPTPVVATDYCPTYGAYTLTGPIVVRNRLLDNSNALFQVAAINGAHVTEQAFDFGYQCGGDDTLFGLRIIHAGLSGWFCPGAAALHLEKEPKDQNFNEPTARAEAILRQTQLLKINNPGAINQMFGYAKKYGLFPQP